MPLFEQHHKKLFFIHIPKTGGSSVEKIAKSLGWEAEYLLEGRSLESLAGIRVTPQHYHAEILHQIFDFSAFDGVFAIVRNPFDRFKSEYYWQISQGISSLGVIDWADNAFSRFENDKSCFDNHIRPQYEFLNINNRLNTFRLEDDGVSEAKKYLLQNGSGKKKPDIQSKIKSLLLKNVNRKVSIKNMQVESEFEKIKNEIVQFYRRDYEEFGYET
jgi:hypothetical protein